MFPIQPFCPRCHQMDRVQKVSGLYAAGRSIANLSGFSTGVAVSLGSGNVSVGGAHSSLSGTVQTALAEQLRPPTQPRLQDFAPRGMKLLRPAGCLAVLMGLFGAAILLIANLIQYESSYSGEMSMFTLLALDLPIGIALWLWGTAANRKARAALTQAEANWREATRRWDNLYYCERDDCSFNPAEQIPLPADRVHDYLYGP